ncbi:unnamed protein product [Thlaspi arvense]|uniref:Phosphofructokinase domain-containing protein n=1 Tax=Thlaspi arvense TaxID=13288 RepID=A0AAU9RPR8_THLAR|nr:unnamed protein product [Thlaspi arvense]
MFVLSSSLKKQVLHCIDKSFGFDTAVEEAQRAINAAHVEAESNENGIGFVKLMGRYSGFIAMYPTLASRDVDCCLIPESPFNLEGEGGLLEFIEKRLKEHGHMMIVLAEGAGQDLMSKSMESNTLKDASGNKLLKDVGFWPSQSIKDHFKKIQMVMNLKYIDPTYMIRAVPSNASDNFYCTLLARSVVLVAIENKALKRSIAMQHHEAHSHHISELEKILEKMQNELNDEDGDDDEDEKDDAEDDSSDWDEADGEIPSKETFIIDYSLWSSSITKV